MKTTFAGAVCAGLLTAVAAQAATPTITDKGNAGTAPLGSGIELANIDNSVRIQDDFYRHTNGNWLTKTEIPADKARYGAFTQLHDDAQVQLRGIIEAAAANTGNAPGSDAQKIGDLYSSFMDEARLETLGAKPLDAELKRIDQLKDGKDIAAQIAHNTQIGIGSPIEPDVEQDSKDSAHYIVNLAQGGLGMPDRDYYLKADDAKLADIKKKYQAHVEKMLQMVGDKDAAAEAQQIVDLETEMAKLQWTKVDNRDPIKTYNKEEVAKLSTFAPGFEWPTYVSALGINGKGDHLIVAQPSYLQGLAKLESSTSLPVWKAYFRWHLVDSYSQFLSKTYVDERFAFNGTVVRGVPENEARWKRGADLVDLSIGEALGKLYVTQYFPPENKARMLVLVNNLIGAYRQRINSLDWMSASSRKEALAKLDKLMIKIGYPDKWRDYSALTIARNDLVGNVMRAQQFEYNRNLNKLGKPIDRSEWGMTPQTVNAYYNPTMDEIVFPAAILQPPFFNVKADDAVNYGGIGAVIGHELSHGFDDQGSQFDSDGNLRDWLTADDHAKFKAKTEALVAQYNAYSPVPGYNVNGELTLGENIADNSGLSIAYLAYHMSLGSKQAPAIDGLTGDQRFYLGWGQVWRSVQRDPETIRLTKIDPHSPPPFRAKGAAINQPAFYTAFDIKPGDKMYVAPDKRTQVW
jgi:predicted metalloendopeptidase